MSHRFISRVALVVTASAMFAPVTAQAGFFDQLFGGSPAPQPSYQPAPQAMPDIVPGETLAPTLRIPKKKVAEAAPVRQKTTDLMRDKTLRPGDAVMMKTGVAVYDGPESGRHNAGQFTPVARSNAVSKTERAALLAMDTTKHDPLLSTRTPDTLASGRSAAVAVPITVGYRITDVRGASVRYVGP